MSTELEKLEAERNEANARLLALDEQIAIQKAIEKFDISKLEDNCMSDVILVKTSESDFFTIKYLLCFKMNGEQHKIHFNSETNRSPLEIAREYMDRALFTELAKYLKFQK